MDALLRAVVEKREAEQRRQEGQCVFCDENTELIACSDCKKIYTSRLVKYRKAYLAGEPVEKFWGTR